MTITTGGPHFQDPEDELLVTVRGVIDAIIEYDRDFIFRRSPRRRYGIDADSVCTGPGGLAYRIYI